jgi:two-component system sensor histidine kinase KdpD
MPKPLNIDRIRDVLSGVGLTLGLVGGLTAIIFFLVWQFGLSNGSVVYLIPVVIAATRWGIVPAVIAAVCGVLASTFFFFPPIYSFQIADPQEVINLILFVFVAVVVSQLATRLKRQLEMARQREIDLRDLYAFSRRLAVAYDVPDIHLAIEDHLASVMQRKVVLFASARDATAGSLRRGAVTVPEPVLAQVIAVASGLHDAAGSQTLTVDGGAWLIRAVSPKSIEFGVIAIDVSGDSKEDSDDLRVHVDAVLADATATLERLGVAHAISEARMRAQTDRLREALIDSVSHELRTPLASILGAATVLSEAPALAAEKKLKALAHDVRDEARRLNDDIQNLLDATRIGSDGVKPHAEWAEAADIVNSAIERCRHRLGDRRVMLNLPADLPLIYIDPVLVQQALVQIVDNAAKYSAAGSAIAIEGRAGDGRIVISVTDRGAGLTASEQRQMWGRFSRGERHATSTSGFGLGLWIANAFIQANGGAINASSEGPDLGTTLTIELPVAQAAIHAMEGDADD